METIIQVSKLKIDGNEGTIVEYTDITEVELHYITTILREHGFYGEELANKLEDFQKVEY